VTGACFAGRGVGRMPPVRSSELARQLSSQSEHDDPEPLAVDAWQRPGRLRACASACVCIALSYNLDATWMIYSSAVSMRLPFWRRCWMACWRGRGRFRSRASLGLFKTRLWQAAVEDSRERGLRVIAVRASPAEVQVSFAAIGDLLAGAGARERLARLAPVQQRALVVALGLAHGPGPPQLGCRQDRDPKPARAARDARCLGGWPIAGGF